MSTTKVQINKSAFSQFSFFSSTTEEPVFTTYKASETDELEGRRSPNNLQENLADQNNLCPAFNKASIQKPTKEKDDCCSSMTKDKKTAMMGFRVKSECQPSQSD